MIIRLNFRALLRPWCWLSGHVWKDYLDVHPGWNREGRYCQRCQRQQFVSYRHEFEGEQTITVRTDWNGTERYKFESHGSGTKADPIRYEKVSVHQQSEERNDG